MNLFPSPMAACLAAVCLLPGCGTISSVSQSIGSSTASLSRKVSGTVSSSARSVGSATANATKATGRFLGSGARLATGSAARLWPWKDKDAQPRGKPPAQTTAGNPAEKPAEKPVEAFTFPTGNPLVRPAEFSPADARLENSSVTLAGGWDIRGSTIQYHLADDGLTAAFLRATGSPASATSSNGDSAEASEIHYRHSPGVLLLRGKPLLRAGSNSVRATSPSTSIRIHLESGAIAVDGPAHWGQ
jgi:hypothetical protein